MSDEKRSALEEKWAARAAAESEADTGVGAGAGAAEVERLRQELARITDQAQRAQADLVNFRRRVERERSERREAERAATLSELLPVVDDFERAVAAEDVAPEVYRQGVELILRALHDNLARLGLTRVVPHGEPFDPTVHEAVERQETDEVPEGHVVAVYQPGYVLGERLVRPAMVAVAAAPADPEAERGASVDED